MRGHNTTLLIYVDDIIPLYWPQDIVVADDFDSYLSSKFMREPSPPNVSR